jgi:non-ribosomal peptide synthetase component F
MILMSAFRAAHYRITAVEDAMVGTPIANRNRRELEDIVGFFVNTQCIRIKVDNETSFRSLLQQVFVVSLPKPRWQ